MDVIPVAELDALSDADFLNLFPAAGAVAAFIVSLGQQACEQESA